MEIGVCSSHIVIADGSLLANRINKADLQLLYWKAYFSIMGIVPRLLITVEIMPLTYKELERTYYVYKDP